jgi:hypothetical protein
MGRPVRCTVGWVQQGDPDGKLITGGQCALCMDLGHRAYEQKRVREIRALRQGKTTAEIPQDVFSGFRDGE